MCEGEREGGRKGEGEKEGGRGRETETEAEREREKYEGERGGERDNIQLSL